MLWYYRHFSRQPVASEQYETRLRNSILSHYYYRVYPSIGKCVCVIFILLVYVQHISTNFVKWLPNCALPPQLRYAHIENYYYKKVLEHYNAWSIMKFLDNNKPI